MFLDSVLIQQDMRVRLPKSLLVNIDGKAGKTKLEIYFDANTREIILRNPQLYDKKIGK